MVNWLLKRIGFELINYNASIEVLREEQEYFNIKIFYIPKKDSCKLVIYKKGIYGHNSKRISQLLNLECELNKFIEDNEELPEAALIRELRKIAYNTLI